MKEIINFDIDLIYFLNSIIKSYKLDSVKILFFIGDMNVKGLERGGLAFSKLNKTLQEETFSLLTNKYQHENVR